MTVNRSITCSPMIVKISQRKEVSQNTQHFLVPDSLAWPSFSQKDFTQIPGGGKWS